MTPGVAAPIPAGVEMSVLDVQIVAADERNVPCPAGWSARSVIVTGDPAAQFDRNAVIAGQRRSEEHTSELQSLMRISYAVFCLKKKNTKKTTQAYKYRVYT